MSVDGPPIGIIAATNTMWPFRSGSTTAGTNYITVDPTSASVDIIASAFASLRRQGARLIVLSLHWGPNMRMRPITRFRAFAHAAIERGIDIVHGYSAHVFQAVERHLAGVILYDTGNFLDDHWNFWNFGGYWNFPFRRDDWSFVS